MMVHGLDHITQFGVMHNAQKQETRQKIIGLRKIYKIAKIGVPNTQNAIALNLVHQNKIVGSEIANTNKNQSELIAATLVIQ